MTAAMTAVVTGTIISTWWWLAGLGYEQYSTVADLLGFHATIEQMEALGVWSINPGVPGFVAAVVAAYIVTRLTAPPPAEIVDLFDYVNGPEWDEEEMAAAPSPGD